MTAATIRASAAYRKRQAAKLKRLTAFAQMVRDWPSDLSHSLRDEARDALQESSDA